MTFIPEQQQSRVLLCTHNSVIEAKLTIISPLCAQVGQIHHRLLPLLQLCAHWSRELRVKTPKVTSQQTAGGCVEKMIPEIHLGYLRRLRKWPGSFFTPHSWELKIHQLSLTPERNDWAMLLDRTIYRSRSISW